MDMMSKEREEWNTRLERCSGKTIKYHNGDFKAFVKLQADLMKQKGKNVSCKGKQKLKWSGRGAFL